MAGSKEFCVIIPTYNNGKTLEEVISSAEAFISEVYVIDDGSTDNTKQLLKERRGSAKIISYKKNMGKGYALKLGLRQATEDGFEAAITMDSDGQHLSEDLPRMLETYKNNTGSLIIGSRSMKMSGMPYKNFFANNFSNFWFRIQTTKKLPDTQSGFRVYPLRSMNGMLPICKRYEAELELLVRSAWRGIPLKSQPIKVYYPKDRQTHFRPVSDFLRIFFLNVFLCLAALAYGYPRMIYKKLSETKNHNNEG